MQKTILLVEEDRNTCQMLKIAFTELNINVLIASDKDEAYDILEAYHVDVLLLNVLYYNENALGGLVNLAKHYYKIKVIIMTTQPNPKDVSFRMGADCAVSKPFDVETITKII